MEQIVTEFCRIHIPPYPQFFGGDDGVSFSFFLRTGGAGMLEVQLIRLCVSMMDQ